MKTQNAVHAGIFALTALVALGGAQNAQAQDLETADAAPDVTLKMEQYSQFEFTDVLTSTGLDVEAANININDDGGTPVRGLIEKTGAYTFNVRTNNPEGCAIQVAGQTNSGGTAAEARTAGQIYLGDMYIKSNVTNSEGTGISYRQLTDTAQNLWTIGQAKSEYSASNTFTADLKVRNIRDYTAVDGGSDYTNTLTFSILPGEPGTP